MDELRTMIAAIAMQALLARLGENEGWEPDEVIDIAVEMADKLLKRLND